MNNLIKDLVHKHARAWSDGNYELLKEILHEDIIFASPYGRFNKAEILKDFQIFKSLFKDSKTYINKIIIDREDFAVQWQFATTKIKTGKRSSVNDAIIGKVKDGKIIVWKEYFDKNIEKLQAEGKLEIDEGQEQFPLPKTK